MRTSPVRMKGAELFLQPVSTAVTQRGGENCSGDFCAIVCLGAGREHYWSTKNGNDICNN